jgi:AraC-like DNA-binding protein
MSDDANRGTLYPALLPGDFRRVPATGAAAELVTWWWLTRWDLPEGEVSRQRVLAYPTTNLVVEDALVGFAGPTTEASHRDLTGAGWAIGARLRPAAVPAFTAEPAALRDRYVELTEPELQAVVAGRVAAAGVEAGVEAVASWLVARVGEVPDEARVANAVADHFESALRVGTLVDTAEALVISVRTLHRITTKYIGLTPHAMLRRRRLQDAAHLLRTDLAVSVSTVAAEFGFADQAHLAHEFRRVLGYSPSEYRRSLAHPPGRRSPGPR